MMRDTTCRSALITVWLLLVCAALGSAQSRQARTAGATGTHRYSQHALSLSDERRVAFVIGNAAYQYTAPLTNPLNDAQDMARVLKDLQFQVILKTNATLDTMADAIFSSVNSSRAVGSGCSTIPGMACR